MQTSTPFEHIFEEHSGSTQKSLCLFIHSLLYGNHLHTQTFKTFTWLKQNLLVHSTQRSKQNFFETCTRTFNIQNESRCPWSETFKNRYLGQKHAHWACSDDRRLDSNDTNWRTIGTKRRKWCILFLSPYRIPVWGFYSIELRRALSCSLAFCPQNSLVVSFSL